MGTRDSYWQVLDQLIERYARACACSAPLTAQIVRTELDGHISQLEQHVTGITQCIKHYS